MAATNKVNVGDAEQAAQFVVRHFQWTGRSARRSRSGLRECGRAGRVKRNASFNFLHGLMNVPVQYGYRPKSFQVRQRLRAVVGSPSPFGIDRPERNVREHNNRRAALERGHVVLEPRHLISAQGTQSSRLEVEHVHQSDEMNAVLFEAVPSVALRTLPETLVK